VSGESWITHLSRAFNDTSMGKTGALGPGPDDEENRGAAMSVVAPPTGEVTLSGADLYRINCRGCHGAEGLGAPPEINSVLNPVRATSAPLVIERMKGRGIEISLSSAKELAKEAKIALLKRLHEGGENMPSFSYLSEPEIYSISTYLRQLAGIPGAAKEHGTVRESPERVGELIVKSTCHICHSATGSNPSEQQLYEGQIPPLESLPSRVDQARFIQKAIYGSPILMGDPPELYRGRMPVFYYFTPQEVADAYLYLSYHPPFKEARSTAAVASIRGSTPLAGSGGDPLQANPEWQDSDQDPPHPDTGLASSTRVLIAGLFALVVVLIAGGLAFTVREFVRISDIHAQPHITNVTPSERQREETHLVAS
jgi:mono/diheme cytochrome c family protein